MTWRGTTSHNLLSTDAGRRKVKAARRAVVVQCSACDAKATAVVNAFGRVSEINLPASRKGHVWTHGVGCGGLLVGFDIEVGR